MLLKFVLSVILFKLISTYIEVTILSFIGLYAVHWWCIENFESCVQIAFNLLKKYLFSTNDSHSLKNQFGEWAVITGATSGIGLEYVKALASQGINIVLVSRFSSKLSEIALQIETNYGVKTKYIVVDFNVGKDVYDRIEKELRDIPIGILVNCVGRMYEFPDEVANVSMDILWNLINLNIGAMVTMTRIVINSMKERRKGAIVNISSGSELQPIPYMTVYAATKVFVRYFTLGIAEELKMYGISVQLLTPYCVRTKFHQSYPVRVVVRSCFFPNVESFIKSAMFTLGKTNETTGYWSHSLMNGAMRLLPVYIRTLIMSQVSQRIHNAYQKERTNDNEDTATEAID